jgi:hypothetical protein
MDEIGFYSHLMKVKKKTIVRSKVRPTEAACRKESDVNHVSLVATINQLGQRLKALYLRTNKAAIKDSDLQLLSSNLTLYQTPKGDQ